MIMDWNFGKPFFSEIFQFCLFSNVKITLYRGITLFSAICDLHYTGDTTNWNRTKRGPPVQGKLRFFFSYLFWAKLTIRRPVNPANWPNWSTSILFWLKSSICKPVKCLTAPFCKSIMLLSANLSSCKLINFLKSLLAISVILFLASIWIFSQNFGIWLEKAVNWRYCSQELFSLLLVIIVLK